MVFRTGAVMAVLVLAASGAGQAAVRQVPAQYATIQAAVDAASAGDEVVVAAGTWEEQVVITTDLTLTGAGVGQTVLRAPVYMPHVVHTLRYNAVIHVEPPATAVTLRNFSVDGAGRGRAGIRFVGIIYYRAGGRAEHLDIGRFHDTPVTRNTSGVGFFSYVDAADTAPLVVDDVSIHDFQKTGFACFGDGPDLEVRNVTVDASGTHTSAIQNGFELLNATSGTLSNCTARGCWYEGEPGEGWTAVGFLFYSSWNWTATDCRADGNQTGVYAISGDITLQRLEVDSYPGDLEYNYGVVGVPSTFQTLAAQAHARPLPAVTEPVTTQSAGRSTFSLSDSRVSGVGNGDSLGLLALVGYIPYTVDLQGCRFEHWDLGLLMSEQLPGGTRAVARNCRFESNLSFGINADLLEPVDARGNAWGDATGPFHPVTNPGGQGDRVSDHVIYAPWLTGNLVCGPVPLYIAQDDAFGTGFADEITVSYLGGGSSPLYGYSVELRWDQTKLAAAVVDVERPLTGSFATAGLFQAMPVAGGLRVDAALGGGRAGVEAGELFRVRFQLLVDTDYLAIPVALTVRSLRDNLNQAVDGCSANDGLVLADVRPPEIQTLRLLNESLPQTDLFAKNGDLLRVEAKVTDGDPLFGLAGFRGELHYLFGGAGWQLLADAYDGQEAIWFARSANLPPTDGKVDYGITVVDPAGNAAQASGEITADNTPPQTPTGFAAEPGHNRIDLSWDDPSALDANLREVVVRARPTGTYPYFDGPAPTYPAGPAEGDGVYSGQGSATQLSYAGDGSGRDVVYFQAFAVDMAGNVSAAAPGARGRCANYRLADVVGKSSVVADGMIDVHDVSRLADSYELARAQPGFAADCDVGPADTVGGSAIAGPDGIIDFEDLMVFADAFAADLHPPVSASAAGAGVPSLNWTRVSDRLWTLDLAGPCPSLKGLGLRLELPDGVLPAVTAGSLLRGQSAPYFLHADAQSGTVSLAMLGHGVGVSGAGELLRLETSRPCASVAARAIARDLANLPLPLEGPPAPPAPPVPPAAFAALGNHPNPFNPETMIVFELPATLRARIVVYSLDGRRIATLLDRALAAGRHRVPWRGRDDAGRTVAAGTYVYRLQAGPWEATGKLELLK